MKRFLLFTAAICLSASLLHAQLTGTKNIPGDYSTLDAAITDLNSQGVGSGGVVINLLAGNSQIAPSGGYSITATGTSMNPIVVTGNNNIITAASPQPTGSTNDCLFKIIGGDYTTIENFVLLENLSNTVTATSTNNMTEFGIALLRSSPSDGAQNNTILNNLITLERTYDLTCGIYCNSAHTATNVQTVSNPTAASGSNSYNKIYGNQISNANHGIAVIGSNTAFRDQGNDIGGSAAISGNLISNCGKSPSAGAFANNAFASGYLIFLNYQVNSNVSFNTVTSATLLGFSQFRGIFQNELTVGGTVVNTISNNTVTVNTDQLSSANCRVIEYITGTGNITAVIDHNFILNTYVGPNTNFTAEGIFCTGSPDAVSISNNTFLGTSVTSVAGFTCIRCSTNASDSIHIDDNRFGTAAGSSVAFTGGATSLFRGIYNMSGAAGCTLSMSRNDFRTIDHTSGTPGSHIYIENDAPNPNTTINENTFTSMNCLNTGDITFIRNNATHAANTTHFVNDNRVVGSYTRINGTGNVYLYYAYGSSPASVTETNNGNDFSNISIPGSGVFYGWYSRDGSVFSPASPSKTVCNNTFDSITAGSGGITVLDFGLANENHLLNSVSGNMISHINSSGPVTGVRISLCGSDFVGNTIHDLNSGARVKALELIEVDSGTVISFNKIYNLRTTANAVIGMYIYSFSEECIVSNNYIGNLYASNADTSNAAVGLYIHTTQLISFFFNTIFIDSGSSGTNFGTSGIYAGANSKIKLNNNLVVNRSVPSGTGKTVVYRRVAPNVPATYDSTSDHNAFYAGLPSPSHLIYSDGVTALQNIPSYAAFVSPADANTITENTTFLSMVGDSSQYLHIAAGAASALESAGMNVPGIATDFDNDTRPGPTGSIYGGGSAPDIGADEFDGQGPCSGNPIVGTCSFPGPQCRGTMFVMSTNGGSTGVGINYQWYVSGVSGGPYQPVFGATTPAFTTAPLYTDMYYIVVVTCVPTGIADTSAEVPAILIGPVVTFQVSMDTLCTTDNAMPLTGSHAGGVFSGPGVSANAFNPTLSGAGLKIIWYTYTDSATSCVISVSDSVFVDYCMTTPTANLEISLSPNPAMDVLTVNSGFAGPVNAVIVNVLGSEMIRQESENPNFGLNLMNLPPGTYFLHLYSANDRAVVPFVKE